MANNRELSQLASFVTVDDSTKTISFGSTISSLNVSGNVNGSVVGSLTGNINDAGVSTITRLEATDINVSGVSTVGVVTSLPLNTSIISIGRNAGAIGGATGDRSIAIGQSAMPSGTGILNVVVGPEAAAGLTTGHGNVLLGPGAGKSLTTGSQNVFIGFGPAYFGAITSGFNVAVGNQVFRGNNGSDNIVLGQAAGRDCVGDSNRNFFAGRSAGQSSGSGDDNVFIGYRAGVVNNGGTDNIFVGYDVGVANSEGSNNIFLGRRAGTANTDGVDNIFIGRQAGLDLLSGDNNIAIGENSGNDAVFDFGSAGALGVGASSNTIVLGNNSHTNAYIKIDWTVTSDERDKEIAGPVPHGLQFVESLKPIKFQFKDRESGEVTDTGYRYGFSAQQIAELEGDPAVIANTNDPENLKVTSAHLVPVLVNAIKELSAKVAELEARLDAQ